MMEEQIVKDNITGKKYEVNDGMIEEYMIKDRTGKENEIKRWNFGKRKKR